MRMLEELDYWGEFIDVIFVVDATKSMLQFFDDIKKIIFNIYDECCMNLGVRWQGCKFRIKVMWFRDFYFNGESAYGESEFFQIPEEMDKLKKYVCELEAKSGSDKAEASLKALEAMTMVMRAMNSDFIRNEGKKRHIIVLFTDAGATRIDDYDVFASMVKNVIPGYEPEFFPENEPVCLVDFYHAWDKMDERSRRLILFTPDLYPWNEFGIDLEDVILGDIERCEEGLLKDYPWRMI